MPVRRPRIVLIDPEAETLKPLCDTLTAAKYDVYSTSDFNEGGTMAMRMRPDLIVIDASSDAGMTLFKNLRRLRRDIPVVGIPASGGQINPMLDEGAVWAQDKFYVVQGMQERPHDPGTKEMAAEFLHQVQEATKHRRAL